MANKKLTGGVLCLFCILNFAAAAADRLTEEELAAVKPEKDDFGASLKIRVGKTSRKENLLGRPSMYSEHGYAPFKDKLLNGSARSSGFSRNGLIQLSACAEQVVDAPFDQFACTLAPDEKGNRSPDILYLDRWMTDRVAKEYRLVGHTEAPWLLLFSSSGGRLISCSDDGSMRLWDVDKLSGQRTRNATFAQEIAKFPCYSHDNAGKIIRGNFAAFSPYGRWLATAFQQEIAFRDPRIGAQIFAWKLFQVETEAHHGHSFRPAGEQSTCVPRQCRRKSEEHAQVPEI